MVAHSNESRNFSEFWLYVSRLDTLTFVRLMYHGMPASGCGVVVINYEDAKVSVGSI